MTDKPIAIGSDDAGLSLKNEIKAHLEARGLTVKDYGYALDEDYPDVAYRLAKDIAGGDGERGILICGTGIGMAITANKVAGVRAAQAHDTYSAQRARKSNDAQILALGSRVVAAELAKEIINAWLESEFEGGNSSRKVSKMEQIDRDERPRNPSGESEAGRLQAEGVLELMGNEGNVVILEGPLGQSAQIQRREGNLAAIETQEGITVLEMQTANWSRAEALTRMENWLVTYGDEIDGVIGQNDEMALGAIEAMRARGIELGSMPTSGIDGITDALLAVQSGELDFSLLQDARGQAEGSLDVLLKSIIGDDYEPLGELWTRYPELEFADGSAKEYNVPWTRISPDNVETLLEEREALSAR